MTIDTILPVPDLFSARRILCIQPHYDDNDIGAAGTLAQLSRKGAELFYLTVTDDLKGVVDASLSDEDAGEALKRDQLAAGRLVGVADQFWLGYPDAGEYDYFDLRRDLLRTIRQIGPDAIFTPDPWLTYEGHRDHVLTGLAAAEAVLFAGARKIASSDPEVDAAAGEPGIEAVAFYYTREPNLVVDIGPTWETKQAVLRCYQAQFDPAGLDQLVFAIDLKSRQAAQGKDFERGEALKVLHPSALHCGI